MKVGKIYEIAINFPFPIEYKNIQAYFITEKRVLYFVVKPKIIIIEESPEVEDGKVEESKE